MSKNAPSLIAAGNLADALAELQASVRDEPADAALRTFLFQLLAVKGDYQRALTQLNVVADLDPEAMLMAQAYRELIQCEVFRSSVFNGAQSPLVLGEPSAWMARLISALSPAAAGDGAMARVIAEDAFAQAPAVAGSIDGKPFTWIADADMRLGPVFEVMMNGKYYWVPCDAIAQVSISAPEDLRDLVWLPAELEWKNGGKVVGFLPGRYPGDATLAEAGKALARKTEWHDLGEGFFVGSGQKMLSTDEDEFALLDCRTLVLSDQG